MWTLCAALFYVNYKIFVIDPNSDVRHKITDMINHRMHI